MSSQLWTQHLGLSSIQPNQPFQKETGYFYIKYSSSTKHVPLTYEVAITPNKVSKCEEPTYHNKTHSSWVMFLHLGLPVFWPLWHSAEIQDSGLILLDWQSFTNMKSEYLLGWQSGRYKWRSTSSPWNQTLVTEKFIYIHLTHNAPAIHMFIHATIFTLQAKGGKKFSHVIADHSSHWFLVQSQELCSSEQLQVQKFAHNTIAICKPQGHGF